MAEQAINTEISLDDADLDFELRDEDFLGRATERAPEPESMEVEVVSANATNGEKSAETIRKNAIYVSGVDDLSTEDMMGYGRKYISDFPFKIEWINDTSLNLVFFSHEEATEAITGITSEAEFYESGTTAPTQLRQAKPFPDKPNTKLQIRFATENDRKIRGARVRSRYYLLHGEPTKDINRRRRKEEDELIVYNLEKQRQKRQQDGEDLFPSVLRKEAQEDLFPDIAEEQLVAKAAKEQLRSKVPGSDNNRRNKEPPSRDPLSARLRFRSRSPQGTDRIRIDNEEEEDLMPGAKDRRSLLSGNSKSASKPRDRSKSPDAFGSRLDLGFAARIRQSKPKHRGKRQNAADLF